MSVSDCRLSLLRDPRLATVVNDVVVEFGSSRYQDLIDRFVRGESVPDVELRQVWENTTAPNEVWDRPMYEEVFRVIRAMNAQLPKARQLRVLLADPPIDWSEIRTAEQVWSWNIERGAFAADLIQREVIAKNRRALAIFGDGHFQGRTARPPRGMADRLSLLGVELLAIASNSGPIGQLQTDVTGWPTPSIAFVRNTPIGAAGYDRFYGPLPRGDYWAANRKFEDHYDAVLYLGQAAIQRSPLTFPRCADSDYVAMRIARMEVAGRRTPPGAPTAAERIKQACHPL